MDDVSDIKDMYDHGIEQEHSRLQRHQLEHDLTWRYLNRYPPPQGSVLEIGAATGRYTIRLCRRGYSVTAVDLSAVLLGECRRQLSAERLDIAARLVPADTRDLSVLAGTWFDTWMIYYVSHPDGQKERLVHPFPMPARRCLRRL